ncbi:helix-turn-helix domain-containing protein [Aggregatilinea lenta]|uniref:helix-turn-helix domain-containing protein n=1 Tax=Aggregatilinea lenta TaxID=913108 RepID=UPI000E5A6FBF|nr:helix-turn-helix domain-containing protein [Aggregatilinea lenta]
MGKRREFKRQNDVVQMLRTYRYRLYPSRTQEANLWRVLEACRSTATTMPR